MASYLTQTVMGIFGSVGFAVLFGIYDWKLVVIALGGGLGWVVYLLCTAAGTGMFVGLFVASLFVASASEILARLIKTPVILLLVPMLIPEIPGGDLYYTMYYLVQNRYPEFGMSSNQVLVEAGAIALGIILASYIMKITESIRGLVKKQMKLRKREINRGEKSYPK